MKFSELVKFPDIHHTVSVSWSYLKNWIKEQQEELSSFSPLQLNPDFQRGHVWTEEQQIRYIEFSLSGGTSGKELYFNHPGWGSSWKGDFVLVDGLQRITAVLRFLNNEIPAFGTFRKDFEDRLPHEMRFNVYIAKLPKKSDVLNWYLLMNRGGTPHSQEEIDRVKGMLNKELGK